MKCPYCAEEIQDDAKKCRYCNEWLDGQGEMLRKNQAANESYKNTQNNAEAATGCGCLLFVVVGWLVFFSGLFK